MSTVMANGSLGDWLLEALVEGDKKQCEWLLALAEFDLAEGWAADGQLSCAEWLVWRGRMSRTTAYEKLQVAHQLRQRPLLAEALRSGQISYSAARAMARMVDPDPEVERAVIVVAATGSVRDVERIVGFYCRHRGQHQATEDAARKRGVRVRPNYDGTSTLQITLLEVEVEEFMAAIDSFMQDQSARADSVDESPDQSARADEAPAEEAPPETAPWANRMADAAMELARVARAHPSGEVLPAGDRYLVHVVTDGTTMTLLDGTPLDESTAQRISCDSAQARILLGPDWEPLAMGRKTKTWSVAQRRAARMRDGGRCRFPGCSRRRVDLHHHLHWEDGGPTDLVNGFQTCDRHHTMLHSGYRAEGNPNRQLDFYRPDGTYLGSTSPQARRPDRAFSLLS